MKGLTISVDDEGIYSVTDFDGGLAELQAAVGGWVEAIPTCDGVTMWGNEEGKICNLPVNRLAMDVWIRWDEYQCMLIGRDWLAGNFVVTGDRDDEGETLDITDAARRWVLRVAADAGAVVV